MNEASTCLDDTQGYCHWFFDLTFDIFSDSEKDIQCSSCDKDSSGSHDINVLGQAFYSSFEDNGNRGISSDDMQAYHHWFLNLNQVLAPPSTTEEDSQSHSDSDESFNINDGSPHVTFIDTKMNSTDS